MLSRINRALKRHFFFSLIHMSICVIACADNDIVITDIGENDKILYKRNSENVRGYYDSLIITQWNIGHFSGGSNPNSTIKPDNFSQAIQNYKDLFDRTNSDICSINEYSVDIGCDSQGYRYKAHETLFANFENFYIGNQRNYSCNAIFSHLALDNVQLVEYMCNMTAKITHTNLISATDYYFIESTIHVNGIEIKLVSTHLAFDQNNTEIALYQIEELIDRYRNDDYVILCGDWNISNVSVFDPFLAADYQLANHGKFGDFITYGNNSILDNVIVKGLTISEVELVNSQLSDHKPLVVTLKLDSYNN
jgi:endonuclease/exonuclease/phosphatase family metal-dependent hydrolase